MKDRDRTLSERRRLREQYGALFEEVSAILFRLDPMGINFGNNPDEYDPEAATILPRLRGCASAEAALRVIHEEFEQWFGAGTAGPQSRYQAAAEKIWDAWQRHGVECDRSG